MLTPLRKRRYIHFKIFKKVFCENLGEINKKLFAFPISLLCSFCVEEHAFNEVGCSNEWWILPYFNQIILERFEKLSSSLGIMAKEEARNLIQWYVQYTGGNGGEWCVMTVLLVDGGTVTGTLVYLSLHFPLVIANTVIHWICLFHLTHGSFSMLVPEQHQAPAWAWAAEAEGHCVQAQRDVAESSAWDPLMYMQL